MNSQCPLSHTDEIRSIISRYVKFVGTVVRHANNYELFAVSD
jgi:hypothetical protein